MPPKNEGFLEKVQRGAEVGVISDLKNVIAFFLCIPNDIFGHAFPGKSAT